MSDHAKFRAVRALANALEPLRTHGVVPWGLAGCGAAAFLALVMSSAYVYSERTGLARLGELGRERLDLYTAALESELGRTAYLPSLVSVDADVLALLGAPGDRSIRLRAQMKLSRINARAGSTRISIFDAQGAHLVSNDGLPAVEDSLQDFALAISDKGQFAVSRDDGSTGYQFLHVVRQAGRVLGAIVVAIDLQPLEATWFHLGLRSESEKLLVLDADNRIILTSVPAWKNRSVSGIEGYWMDELPKGSRTIESIGEVLTMRVLEPGGPGCWIVGVEGREKSAEVMYQSQDRALVALSVRLVALSDLAEVKRNARYAAWVGLAGAAFVSLIALYMLQRFRAVKQLTHARNALQHAHDDLERQVARRTSELRNSNADLERQIAERLRVEHELIQAGKLAALGQMSAGITHEINQPLTALRALSSNTLKLLDIGNMTAAVTNLQSINEVAERLGQITLQLKNFARKSNDATGSVSLRKATANVQLLLEHRLRAEQVLLSIDIPQSDAVRCDSNRLEQVLLNLSSNALDAMTRSETKRLTIAARRSAEIMHVRVSDTGGPVAPEVFERLFEPFFTTKPAGEGLGLGLVVSSKIVREFGGSLRAINTEEGLVFEFDLALAIEVVDV